MPVSVTTGATDNGVIRDKSIVATQAPSEQPSAVSWAAVFAGAAGAAALSLIMLLLGTGLGLSVVSPWSQVGITAATLGMSTILWVTFTQLVASGMGGYLAGRLRVKWVAVHSDEVYFRDTAHGFLSWAVASLSTAALLGSVIASMAGTGVQASASLAGAGLTTGVAAMAGAGATKRDDGEGPMGYLIDSLFRRDSSSTAAVAGSGDSAGSGHTSEIARIFINGLGAGTLPPEDARYVAQVVARRTGITAAEAEKRVSDVYARAKSQLQEVQNSAREVADAARKTSAYAALWLFASLLIGAFSSSLAATFGGRQRDT